MLYFVKPQAFEQGKLQQGSLSVISQIDLKQLVYYRLQQTSALTFHTSQWYVKGGGYKGEDLAVWNIDGVLK